MLIKIQDWEIAKKRKIKLQEYKQQLEKTQRELEDVYDKNGELSQTLEEATSVIKRIGTEKEELVESVEQDTRHIEVLVKQNQDLETEIHSLSQDVQGLKTAWVGANVPQLKSDIRRLTQELAESESRNVTSEALLENSRNEIVSTRTECHALEVKARIAMDDAVRALHDAAHQTYSAESEIAAMRNSLREAKCYTLHTTLGRVTTNHKKEEERLSRMVSHLQALVNRHREEKKMEKKTMSTLGMSFPKFVTLSGIVDLRQGEHDVRSGVGVVVNARMLYHFHNEENCLTFFHHGSIQV